MAAKSRLILSPFFKKAEEEEEQEEEEEEDSAVTRNICRNFCAVIPSDFSTRDLVAPLLAAAPAPAILAGALGVVFEPKSKDLDRASFVTRPEREPDVAPAISGSKRRDSAS